MTDGTQLSTTQWLTTSLCAQKIPPSGAAPSFKLTLPHQVVHQYLLHLVDNDLELAGSPDAEQTWHASIAPRTNKERSEFTLQVLLSSLKIRAYGERDERVLGGGPGDRILLGQG